MWLAFPSAVMASDCPGMVVGVDAGASDAAGASVTCSCSWAFCALVWVPLSCWRVCSANSSFSRDWMRSSKDSWNVAAAGSGSTPNRSELVVDEGWGFWRYHLSRCSLNHLPVMDPGMKHPPGKAMRPSLRSMHFPSRMYSLRISQLFLK